MKITWRRVYNQIPKRPVAYQIKQYLKQGQQTGHYRHTDSSLSRDELQ